MTTAMPLQLAPTDIKFAETTKTATDQMKNVGIFIKISRIILNTGLNAFFGSILALNFMAFQIGLSLKYPALLTTVFG